MLQSVASHGYLRLMICSIRHIVFRLNLFILLSLPMFCFGQDLHFSQYYLHPMDLSPAACGIFEGDLRISAAYRSQWRSVPVNYQTFMGSVDWKAFEKGNNLVSLGLLFDRDEAGDAGLSWLQNGGASERQGSGDIEAAPKHRGAYEVLQHALRAASRAACTAGSS